MNITPEDPPTNPQTLNMQMISEYPTPLTSHASPHKEGGKNHENATYSKLSYKHQPSSLEIFNEILTSLLQSLVGITPMHS